MGWTLAAWLVAWLPIGMLAQAEGPEPAEQTTEDIGGAWGDLIDKVIPSAATDPALSVEQAPVITGPVGDFGNHFFFESHIEYLRQQTSFSGLPTVTGVVDAPRGEVADPDAIPYEPAFQPGSNHVYTFLNFGTRGWLSPRVNSSFSFRYRQDLTSVTAGSPSLSLINTYPANRRIEMLSGFVEVEGLSPLGGVANTSLKVGRQHVFGAETASLDGASFSIRRRSYSLTLFGGRRATFFSDPEQRAMGGANLALRLPGDTVLEYQNLFYVRGSHVVGLRKRFNQSWLVRGRFKMVGGSAVDLGGQVHYFSPDGRSSVGVGFLRKLSDKDFQYDYTLIARERDPFNRLPRLYLGRIPPYNQFTVTARREIFPRLRLGGTVYVRRLDDAANNQSAYAASFEDYRVHAQVYPAGKLEMWVEYHHRNTDRLSPLGVTAFDDSSRSGETRVQDFSGELRRSFGEGRLTLKGGAFYRRMNLQNPFFFIDGADTIGFLGGFSLRVNDQNRMYVDYTLDEPIYIFRPSIQRSQVLRVGWNFRY